MKKTVSIILLILIINISGIVYAEYDYSGSDGIFDDSTLFSYTGTIGDASVIFDNNTGNSCLISKSSDYVRIVLSKAKNITYQRITCKNITFSYYDKNNKLLGNLNSDEYNVLAQSKLMKVDYNEVKYITIKSFDDIDGRIYEYEIFTDQLDDITVVATPSVNKINLSWNTVLKATGYRIYINNVLYGDISTFDYTVDNLLNNTIYSVKVVAYNLTGASSSQQLNVKTLSYFSAAPSSSVNDISYFSAKIKWTAVPDTKFYEVKLNDDNLIQTDKLDYKFDNLQHSTNYTTYVRQVNLADEISDWTIITFRTLGPPEVPPSKPDKVTIISKGIDNLEVESTETLWASEYMFYLNNKLITTQSEKIYKFIDLKPSTQYSISVKAKNQYGISLFAASIIGKTEDIPIPTVTSAQSSFVSGSPTKQNVTWQSKNTSQGFKIYINGKLVKEVPAGQNSIEIDLSEFSNVSTADIEVLPAESDGKGYKFSTITKGTGNSDFDQLTGKMLDGRNIIKKGGIVLLQAIITMALLFVISLFLFNKMKLNLATNDDQSLEANPDEQIKAIDSKNKFDRNAYFIAKLEESSHDNKKNEEFNFKSLLNDLVNKPKKGKGQKKYKINVNGKNVEIDKTSYFANKYSDFKNLNNKSELYQWQNKYNDFSQSSFNKFDKKINNKNGSKR